MIVDSFFDKSKLDACRQAIEVQVDNLANMLYDGGKIKSKSPHCLIHSVAEIVCLTRSLVC